MSDRCSACGKAALQERIASFEVIHNGKHGTIDDRQTHCAACGNVSYVGSQISGHELAVGAKIREMEGLLSAEELRRIRLKYAFRQTDLEQMLSVGPKTWTRWERGRVPQSKAADTLIRVLAENPDVARRLMEQAQIDNPDAAAAFDRFEAIARSVAVARLREEMGASISDADISRVADRAIDTVRNVRREIATAA